MSTITQIDFSTCAWLGGKTIQEVAVLVRKLKLKSRKGGIGIMDTVKMRFEMRPIIECWAKEKRKYLPFEYANTPWFKSVEERDAVFNAIRKESWIAEIKEVARKRGMNDDGIATTDWEVFWETYGLDGELSPVAALNEDASYA